MREEQSPKTTRKGGGGSVGVVDDHCEGRGQWEEEGPGCWE